VAGKVTVGLVITPTMQQTLVYPLKASMNSEWEKEQPVYTIVAA